jgi:hypothetical protein
MNEHIATAEQRALEKRSRALFHGSVEGLDMAMRSRLTQARHAALEAARASGRRGWLARMPLFAPALGVSVAVALVFAVWFGNPLQHHGMGQRSADNASTFEDLEIVAASDEGAGDAMEMLQDDVAFYDWAEDSSPDHTRIGSQG